MTVCNLSQMCALVLLYSTAPARRIAWQLCGKTNSCLRTIAAEDTALQAQSIRNASNTVVLSSILSLQGLLWQQPAVWQHDKQAFYDVWCIAMHCAESCA